MSQVSDERVINKQLVRQIACQVLSATVNWAAISLREAQVIGQQLDRGHNYPNQMIQLVCT